MAEPRSTRRALPSGNVTFLFTDIEGSTRMFHHLGDAFVAVVEDHRSIVRGALAHHGGVEVSTEGDGFFIAFSDAAAAVAACLTIQQTLAAHVWPDHGEVRVRMGLHTGIARPINGDYLAIAVHQAARIAATAHGGQVIVSSDTSRLVDRALPEDCSLADRGLFVLKDFDEPARLFQLLHPTLPAAFAPLRAPSAQSRSLPDVRTTFVGREADVKNIVDILDEIRLLSIVGPGGAGKTRLALEIGARLATRFEAGTQLCDLSPIADPALVARTIASAYGIRNTPDSDPLETVARTVAGADVLFVLDNCEHVIDAAASAVESLLSHTGGLRILATSREPLSIPGEQVWRIAPLGIPEVDDPPDVVGATESGHLFEERARQVQPGFTVTTDNALAVVSICRQLEGLPLALELAAAQVAVMDPSAIADRLSGRLQKLGSRSRRGTDRHRTLEATIDWSYQLLDDDERRLLNALSVCAGGFTVDAVDAVGASDDAVELLTGLVQKSLVIWDPDGGRYRLLETIRQYAADRLAGDESEHERALDAHVDCYYRLACTAESALTAAQQDTWLEVLSHDHDNLRRAIARLTTRPDDAERALRMLTALYRYWMIRANLGEWIALTRPLVEHAGTGIPPLARGHGLVAAALVSIYEDTSLARQLGETALEIARRMDDDYLRADAMSVLAAISHFQGDHDPAAAEQALTLSRRIGDTRLVGQALMCYGLAARKDPELARQLYREAIAVTHESGDHFVRYIATANLATIDAAAGESERGQRGFEDALQLSESLGYDDPLLFSELGLILLDAGDLEGARHRLVSALRGAGTSLYQSAAAIEGIAQYATKRADWGGAASLFGFVDGAMRTAGMPVTDDNGSLGTALALLREKLGDDDYERHFRAGTALAWEKALALARTALA